MNRALRLGLLCLATVAGCSGGDPPLPTPTDAGSADTGIADGGATCGDGTCSASEDRTSCPADCELPCGNGACSADESCATCPADCSCTCGDGELVAPEQCDPPNGTTCDDRCNLIPSATPIVIGAGLIIQDSSEDGARLAYTDGAKNLFVVSVAGGAPRMIVTQVDRARFHGELLVVHQGVDAAGLVASTTAAYRDGETTATITGARVVIDSIRASFDGRHLYHQELHANDPTLGDLYLDGQRIVTDVRNERARFDRSNTFLVVASDHPDPADTARSIGALRAFPLAGGAPITLVASNATRRFDLTPDGSTVVAGTNEQGPLGDIALIPIGGGPERVLVRSTGEDGFRLLSGSQTLIFLSVADPNTPSQLGLDAIGLDGSGRRSILPDGAIDILDTSDRAIIYATSQDANTGLEAFSLIRIDGTGNVALGPRAVEEGFSTTQGWYTYRDGVVRQNGEWVGRLRSVNVSSGVITDLASGCPKASRVDTDRIVHLSQAGVLSITELAAGTTTVIENAASSFEVVASGAVAFSISSGTFAGIYLEAL